MLYISLVTRNSVYDSFIHDKAFVETGGLNGSGVSVELYCTCTVEKKMHLSCCMIKSIFGLCPT